MPLIKVAHDSDLPLNSVLEIILPNDRPIALCNIAGQIHALDGTCPHRGGPLGQGAINGTSLTCPWHAWDFDCVTGLNPYDPSHQVEVFRVCITGGDILIDLP